MTHGPSIAHRYGGAVGGGPREAGGLRGLGSGSEA
jgi:hypothetical protein